MEGSQDHQPQLPPSSSLQAQAGPEAKIKAGNLFNVEGIVALVTGGGTGIGYLIASALAHNGATRVYICGRRLEILQTAASRISASGAPPGMVVPLYCDVTSKVSLASLVSIIEHDIGRLNILFCNSGVGGPFVPFPIPPSTTPGPSSAAGGASSGPGGVKSEKKHQDEGKKDKKDNKMTLQQWASANWDHDIESFTDTFRSNVSSVWYTTMAFLPLLEAGNKAGNVEQTSQVIATSSIAAFNKAAPGGSAYGISKAAVVHLVKQLSVVLPQYGIRANCIAPGLFPSEMADPIIARAGGPQNIPIPLGRIGDEQDMAGVVLYLASRAGAYCNGNVITVDGGRLVGFPTTF